MDGMQWAFVGICLCIVLYGLLAAWGHFMAYWRGYPSLLLYGIYGDTVWVAPPRGRIRQYQGSKKHVHSVKLKAKRTPGVQRVVPVVSHQEAYNTSTTDTGTIDDRRVQLVRDIIKAGIITNRAEAICTIFRCSVQSASKPTTTYQRVLRRLIELDAADIAAKPEQDIVINRPRHYPVESEPEPEAAIPTFPPNSSIIVGSFAEHMSEIPRPS